MPLLTYCVSLYKSIIEAIIKRPYNESPEITNNLVIDRYGPLTLQIIEPSLLIPENSELDRLFAELVEELDLTAPNKASILKLPEDKKWQIYCCKKNILEDQKNTVDLSQSPENYIERIKSLSRDEQEHIKLFDTLKTALRTQPHSFVLKFLQYDGLVILLEVLSSMDYNTLQRAMHASIIGCIKVLMDNSTGRSHVLSHPTAISTIARSLLSENPRTEDLISEILGASSLVPSCHKKLYDAMTNYKEFACERARFQGIINDLDRNTGIYCDYLTVKTEIMSFVNAFLSDGAGQESLEFRLHLSLAKEEVLVAVKNKIKELERKNSSIAAALPKMEQELDSKNKEKENMDSSISMIKEHLEKEISVHLEAKQKITELEDTISELQHRVTYEQAERKKLESILRNGSGAPNDVKANFNAPSSSPNPPPPPQLLVSKSRGPTPPPAPPHLDFPLIIRQRIIEIPKPSVPLKSFNWAKLPETKIAGTIWADIEEGKMYTSIDLESVDKLFCAFQNQKSNSVSTMANEGSYEDLRQTGKNKSKVLTIIDGRRAHNCTILLSRLKMSDEEIAKLILNMDTKGVLPLDMVEQLLKFIPSPDEVALLEEHSYDSDSLARADRFFYEISKIAHYEQRLRSLMYKKKFITWTNEVEGRTQIVMEASREVACSGRLRKLLTIILALGNYMNKGTRGNAWGFHLSSLKRLKDTKSSFADSTTLLHFIVDVADQKFKDVLLLDEDLRHVRGASKISLAELENDMTQLRNNLKEVEREIEFQRAQIAVPGDIFLPVMEEFLTIATCKFSKLEDLFQNMKTTFEKTVKLFGEDNSTIQPDDFFAIFDSFLTSLSEASLNNITVKKKHEKEEKRTRQAVELKKLTLTRKNCNGRVNDLSNGERQLTNQESSNGLFENTAKSDDLILALKNRNVFGEDSMAEI